MINPSDARQLIRTEARRHAVVVHYRKLDGSSRRLVCRYDGAASRKPSQIVVWDQEQGGYRTVNLKAVERVIVCGRPAATPKRSKKSFAERQAEMQELFY